MKKVINYPVEYLSEAYIHPRTMRKSEVARLIDLPWQVIKTHIREDEELKGILNEFNYSPNLKFLYQTHVAILFQYFGPPLASERNRQLSRRIGNLQCA